MSRLRLSSKLCETQSPNVHPENISISPAEETTSLAWGIILPKNESKSWAVLSGRILPLSSWSDKLIFVLINGELTKTPIRLTNLLQNIFALSVS
jgi:hypothetical protein